MNTVLFVNATIGFSENLFSSCNVGCVSVVIFVVYKTGNHSWYIGERVAAAAKLTKNGCQVTKGAFCRRSFCRRCETTKYSGNQPENLQGKPGKRKEQQKEEQKQQGKEKEHQEKELGQQWKELEQQGKEQKQQGKEQKQQGKELEQQGKEQEKQEKKLEQQGKEQ